LCGIYSNTKLLTDFADLHRSKIISYRRIYLCHL
jgi:hypothetical protein